MSERLIDAYDAALFDLDGVIYLGPLAIDGAAEGVSELRSLGVRVGFVTNNAARPPITVAEHLSEIAIPCEPSDVVTSAQAGARMLADALPAGSRVLITGTPALAAEAEALGFVVVDSAADAPEAVLQGYDPQMTQPRLDEAGFALQGGARWFATNTDPSRPTDRGQVPGAGAQIDAVGQTVAMRPEVAGKPYPPLLLETIRRIGCERAIFVGDRIDTDIEGAINVSMDSLFVFTGTHGMHDLLTAPENRRPTAIGWDLRSLLQPARTLSVHGDAVHCGESVIRLTDQSQLVVDSIGAGRDAQLDALWAILAVVWAQPDVEYTTAVAQLSELR